VATVRPPRAFFAGAATHGKPPAVQLDQFLRRLSWRARRRFGRAAADNDPLVTVEAPLLVSTGAARRPRLRLPALLAAAGLVLIACAVLMAR
jgi:hypothetical protein